MIQNASTPVTLNETAQSIMFGDDNFMLIPQLLTKWDGTNATTGAYLSVLCRIYSLDGGNETLLYPQPTTSDDKTGKYAFAAVGIDTNWEPGKKYTYTLNFSVMVVAVVRLTRLPLTLPIPIILMLMTNRRRR